MKRATDPQEIQQSRQGTHSTSPASTRRRSTTPSPTRRQSNTLPPTHGRSTTPPPTTNKDLPANALRAIEEIWATNYRRMPSIVKDAIFFTAHQLQEIFEEEPRRLRGIDLLHMGNCTNLALFGFADRENRIGKLPLTVRRRWISGWYEGGVFLCWKY